MTLLERVVAVLSEHRVAHALIGASALAVHGVSRSTLDQDLLTMETRVLDDAFWAQLEPDGAVEVRRGDVDDPLAGVVRIRCEAERDVDVVVGRHPWQADILGRAMPIGPHHIPVAEAGDLVLLKLYAGGSQDRWDIEQLLALDLDGNVAHTVDTRVEMLPPRSRDLWSTLRPRK